MTSIAHRLLRRSREGLADEFDLLLAHPALLEGQRARGVDAEHGHTGQLDERAQAVVDEAPVTRQRRQEAAQHVVQRDVVVAGDAEDLVAALAQALEELARLAGIARCARAG